MVQIRVMSDDFGSASRVLEVLLPLLEASPDLVVGDTTELSHRGGGRRVVFDLSPTRPGPVGDGPTADGGTVDWEVRVEWADRPPRSRPRSRVGAGQRALPPGSSR